MKTLIMSISIAASALVTSACHEEQEPKEAQARWIVDRFDDIKVIRYEVPGFEQLPLEEKELI